MKEIKFRAWDKKHKTMLDVKTLHFRNKLLVEHSEDEWDWYMKSVPTMQYAGSTDKNGELIFEGDIIHCNYMGFAQFNAIVRFGEYNQDGSGGEYTPNECIGFYAKAIKKHQEDEWGCRVVPDYLETTSLLIFENIEVIGNIYDSPELLEGENK